MVISAIIPVLYAIIDSVSEREQGDSIRQQAVRGGVYLVVRRGVSVILGLVGVLLLTRIVGPAAYGVYSAAQGIFQYLLFVGLMSVHIYLIRAEGVAERALFDQAFWWLLLFSGGLTTLAAGAIYAVGTLWVRTENFVSVALLLCANLPLTVVSYVPMAILERKLAYGVVASVEVASQLVYYAVAIPLAWAGYGVWSLVAGFWVGQLVLPLGFFGATRYRPRWQWNPETLRPMLRYGFMQALSEWLYNLRELAP
ncbi:MAG: oligosaccharide flippase family protein, partial [Fimbriimonadales bacterium]|nr:oligosaccharide flippase family protein [Fimbriimonadales bacterium]